MATTFLVLQQELADRLNLDQTVSANGTRLKRWLNLTQNDIASRYPFEWLFSRTSIQTIVDKTAGTVAIANGGTTVTGSGTAFAATDKRSFIQFQNDTNWYEVVTYSSSTSIAINSSTPFVGTTLTAGTYTLRTVYYDLPTDLFQVFDVRQTNTPLKLTNLGIFTFDTFQPDMQTVSQPAAYYLFRDDPDIAATAAKQRQIAFFPSPDAQYNIEVRYFLEQADLSADGDIPLIPPPYLEVLLSGAEWLGNKFLNSSNQDSLKQSYEYGIGRMIEQENAHGDYLPVLGTGDPEGTSRFLPFPTTFQQPQ